MAEITSDRSLGWYAAREPLVLILLAALAVGFFFVVAGLSKIYVSQRESQAEEWFSRGMSDFQAGRLQSAVNEFHIALSYSRDNYQYQVSLAEALLAMKRTEEANAYLMNLWQREPENGTVNLELARIYAGRADMTNALRYYHNAVYAVWTGNPEAQRRVARLELINFLLRHNDSSQAESELIALTGNLPEDASLYAHVGDLFMEVPDYERALREYRSALKLEPRNAAVLAGAGHAAFEMGRYSEAEHFLQQAVILNPADKQSAELLELAKQVQEMDPDIVVPGKRAATILGNFRIAGERLNKCSAQAVAVNVGDAASLEPLSAQWAALKARLTEGSLREHPQLDEAANDLIFTIEERTNEVCGTPTGADLALLLIARQHGAS